MAKPLYRKDTGEILGVHIIGLHAADLIHEASNAIAPKQTVQVGRGWRPGKAGTAGSGRRRAGSLRTQRTLQLAQHQHQPASRAAAAGLRSA